MAGADPDVREINGFGFAAKPVGPVEKPQGDFNIHGMQLAFLRTIVFNGEYGPQGGGKRFIASLSRTAAQQTLRALLDWFSIRVCVKQQTYNRSLHWMALATTAATFPLIFMGGLVTSHQAGMSVPDWPNSWGYNMFTFPIHEWVGGIWYEHTHRLAGAFVGFLVLVLTAMAWLTDKRPSIRWTSIALLLAVCVQGTLGGLRVVLSALDLAIVHGCAAQFFFCFAATFCIMTSKFAESDETRAPTQGKTLRRLSILAEIASAVVVSQLIVGAIMRHSGAGLAIPDFPTSYGSVLPPTHLDADFRQQAIHQYGSDIGLNRETLFQIWIHFAHRIGAVAVTLAIGALSIAILRRGREFPRLSRLAIALVVLLAAQITLGILTVLWRKPADVASLHVAVGSLVLMTTWVTFVQIMVLRRPYLVAVDAKQNAFEPVMAGNLAHSGPADLQNGMAVQ